MSLSSKMTSLANGFRSGASINHLLSVDDMRILMLSHSLSEKSGVNLLQGTDPVNIGGNIDEFHLAYASGGYGQGSIFELPANFKAKNGFQISNNTFGSRDFNQRPVFYDGSKYTFTFYCRRINGSANAYVRSWSTNKNTSLFDEHIAIDNTWTLYTVHIDSADWYKDTTASLAFGTTAVDGIGSVQFAEPMLVKGDNAAEWKPSPYDMGG